MAAKKKKTTFEITFPSPTTQFVSNWESPILAATKMSAFSLEMIKYQEGWGSGAHNLNLI